MYAIVEWVGSNPPQVSAVPSNWLVTDELGKLQSYWPSSSSDVLAFKQRREPRSSWEKYDVRHMGTAESYDEAIAKQNKAQMTSDLSADESLNDRPTRHQRCRIEFSEGETPTRARSRRSQATTIPKPTLPLVPLPIGLQSSGVSQVPSVVPPTVVRHRASVTSQARPCQQQPIIALSLTKPAVSRSPSVTATAAASGSLSIVSSNSCVSPVSTIMSPPTTTPCRSQRLSTTPDVTRDSNTPFMQALQQLCRTAAETKEQVMYNTQLLQDIARRRHDTNKERIGRLPSSCHLPMTTYSEVLAVEQQLKSKEFYCQFVSYLSLIGGSTIKDFVSRTMTRVLDGKLAKKFVWAGRLTEKHAFKTLELKNVLVEATQKNPLTSRATEAETEDELKLWLRGAPDRNGGRSARTKKAAEKKKRKLSARTSHSQGIRSRSSGRDRRRHSYSSSCDRGRRSHSSGRNSKQRTRSSSPDQRSRSCSSVQDRARSSSHARGHRFHSLGSKNSGLSGGDENHRSRSSSRHQLRRSRSWVKERPASASRGRSHCTRSPKENQAGSHGRDRNQHSRSSSHDRGRRSRSCVQDRAALAGPDLHSSNEEHAHSDSASV